MKHILMLALLLGPMTLFAQSIDGDWKGTRETPNGTIEITYSLKADGNKLTGVLKSSFGELPIENGKIDGKKFSFSVTINDFTINNTGELTSDDEMMIKNERGEYKMTRVK
jgi:hypothetical protein